MSPCKNSAMPLRFPPSLVWITHVFSQVLIDQLVEDVKHVRPAVEKTRPQVTKNPDVDRLEEDVNRMAKRWGNCCMQVRFNHCLLPKPFLILCFKFKVVERLRSCEAACELLEKYNMSYTQETNWMDELDSKLRNLEELEEARAKEAWEKHVVSRIKLTLVIPGQKSLTNRVKSFRLS